MNWKIIVGILIILGSVKEMYAEINDFRTGIVTGNPIYGEIGCAIFASVGFYLIYKGRQKKPFK